MRGAVAAGHPQSARAGARMLERGGNAVDACVAAAFAAAVCESPLTGLGGGGFLLVHRARDRSTRLADCFVAAPGLGARRRRGGTMIEIDVGFGDSPTTQPFRIGPASVAVPGLLPGLEAAHRAYGRLPWREVVVPACELAQDGVRLTRPQAHIHTILDLIIRRFDEGRRVLSGPGGDRLAAGELLRMPDLADTLERVGQQGAAALARGRLARATVKAVREGGGELTADDLAAYRVVWRRPVGVAFAGHRVLSNPPPSSGGILIAYGLALLARLPSAATGSPTALVALAQVMREQERARGPRFSRRLRRGGLAASLLAPAALTAARRRIEAGTPGVLVPAAPGGTTHVSVLDSDGNAASLSSSTGSGSGVIVPGTGIYLNNMLGEHDLVGPRQPRPGSRLTSMMAPTVALDRRGRARLVLGSAGSARLRGAITQVAVNVLLHGLTVPEAIEAPRIHLEEPLVHCEGGQDPEALAALARVYELVSWRRRNLFFGGVAGVALEPGGALAAAGDPRRGGAGLVVANGLRVRPAVPGDAGRIVALASAVASEAEGWLLADSNWRSVGEERRYIRTVQRSPDATLLVATAGEEIVGRLSIMRDPHPSSAHVADIGLMVAASRRRRGVGSALMVAAETWARGASVSKLELHVFPDNLAAIALYEKLGYTREGLRVAHYRRPDGSFTDAILMAKRLP